MNDICLSAERLCLKVDVLAAKRRCFVWLSVSAEKRYCNFVNFCRENSNLWKVNQIASFAVREFGFTRGLRTEEHFHTCFHFLWFFPDFLTTYSSVRRQWWCDDESHLFALFVFNVHCASRQLFIFLSREKWSDWVSPRGKFQLQLFKAFHVAHGP